jgi:hypothetical protein
LGEILNDPILADGRLAEHQIALLRQFPSAN